MRFFVFTLFSAFAIANIPLLIETPETEVEVSIFDLVKQEKSKAYLPKDYGNKVAKILEENREGFSKCLKLDEKDQFTLDVILLIAGSGTGKAQLASSGENIKTIKCLNSEFQRLEYPKHPFSKNVSIKFPLTLERSKI